MEIYDKFGTHWEGNEKLVIAEVMNKTQPIGKEDVCGMENNPIEKVMIGYLIFTLGKGRMGQRSTL